MKRSAEAETRPLKRAEIIPLLQTYSFLLAPFLSQQDIRRFRAVSTSANIGWIEHQTWLNNDWQHLSPNDQRKIRRLKVTSNLKEAPPLLVQLEWNSIEALPGLPSSLRILKLSSLYSRSLPNPLPPSLQTLQVGDGYKQVWELDYCFGFDGAYYPKHGFNEPLPPLPESLRTLVLGQVYKHPLPPRLPELLLELTVGSNFNHPLPDPLPASLQTLMMGHLFNRPLPRQLTESLQILVLGQEFNQPFVSLPPSLQSLEVGRRFNHVLPHPLPPSLHTLIMRNDFNHVLPHPLPPSLHTLIMGADFNHRCTH